METALYFDDLSCPENDEIFTDIAQESYNDETIILGYKWQELRELLWNDPYFNRLMFM